VKPPAAATAPQPVRLADYRPPAWRAPTIDLVFDLHEDHATVTSTVAYERAPDADPGDHALRLDGEDLELVSIALDGRPLAPDAYALDEERLVLDPPADAFTLEIVTRIEPQANTKLSGLYRSGGTFCTQMEAEGFRRVTFWQDRPDVLSRWTTTIEADAERYPVLLGNGNPASREEVGGGRVRAVWSDPFPKPSYLFALVAGDLRRLEDTYTTRGGRRVALHVWVDPGNEAKARHTMDSLRRALAWDEQRFGREYDLNLFNIVAVHDFNMGAMENKSLNIFNAALVLADPRTATDEDYRRIEGVVGHEYFHNWSGNRVTCRDWFQLSLKEGFTVFRDQEFSADMNDRAVQRIADVRKLRSQQFPEDAGPLAHPVRPESYIAIDNFYTRTVYEKGAEVIRMQANLLGPDAFRAGTDLYFERHDGQAVTTEDFVRAMEDASGRDLSRLRRWYEQAGTPVLVCEGRHDPAAATYTLRIEQRCAPTPGQPDKLPFHVPVAVGLLDPDGHEVADAVLELTEARQSFVFEDVERPPVPSVLRGFSAPARVEIDLSDEELLFLVEHDTDAFNRWESMQRLAARVVLRGARDHAEGAPPRVSDVLVRAVEHTCAAACEGALAPAIAAELLTLPDVAELGELSERIDVDGLHAARRAVLVTLAARCGGALGRVHEAFGQTGAWSVDAAAIGRRSLRNAALALLTAPGDDVALERASRRFDDATNMTDQMAALTALADHDDPRRPRALARFLEQWRDEPLVMNKWLSVQAGADRDGVVDDVRRLARHEVFDAGNPNALRALYRTFSENVPHFHRADGSGYALYADMLAELDPANPVLAARLASAFGGWRRYDERRAAAMRGRLERLAALEGLSRNTYEIVTRTLRG